MCNRCDFKVGDKVDWRNPQYQRGGLRYYYHGEILSDIGNDYLGSIFGHVLLVRWTCSNRFGLQVIEIPEGTKVIVPEPWEKKELCEELVVCEGVSSQLHGGRNWRCVE